jgi:hypothetical protein
VRIKTGLDFYTLDDHGDPHRADLGKWAEWMSNYDRQIGLDMIGSVGVSTVYIGHDMSLFGDGPPLLFETMIFGGARDREQFRYATLAQAKAGHAAIVAELRAS